MKIIITCCLLGVAIADLRQASQPKQGYKLKQQGGGRGAKNFVVGTGSNPDGTVNTQDKGTVLYMEPSIFGYGGLANQRKNNYDNFLRSNIDNEQDNRNFNNELGKDMLPYRTYDGAVPTAFPYQGAKPGGDDDSLQVNNVNVQTVLKTAPGEPRVTPLRWNNPHAAEIEVNLWIMASDPPTIVPVKKPACSGEGNQNNIIQWAIPADFNNMAWANCEATKTFTGCNNPGDCVLQIYAHSVETRQYSTAFPIVITGAPTPAAQQLAFTATAADADEINSFAWPKSYDLESMVGGKKPGNPNNQGGAKNTGGTGGNQPQLTDIQLCASSEREGIKPNGETVQGVTLLSQAQKNANQGTIPKLVAPTVNLYLCKNTPQEIAAEQLVDQVIFEVSNSADGNTFTAVAGTEGKRTENYTPYEMSTETQFGGGGFKEVKATIKAYSGTTVTVTAYLDLRGNTRRWRFRRHLQPACPTGTPAQPVADPWMDLSQLNREVCRSAQDPNANYPTTTLQYAALHSDVANHAYQNSDYSPYSGQQHGEISRQMQAAAVIHMTSGNRGELGKANIPNAVKAKVAQLNKAVNNIYQNYEKVANKVIDELTKQQKNGAGAALGVQPLGESFRSLEKGATSTKRLKTTTYVPSFDAQGYNAGVIANAIESKTKGNKAKYADLLSTPKPNTNRQYIEIYTASMNQMLPAFAEAASLGITYQPSIRMTSCTILEQQNAELAKLSKLQAKNGQAAAACCTGSMQNTQPGGCGGTTPDATNFRKRNANNQKDGGLYAAKTFTEQRYQTLYNCPAACLNQETNNGNLAKPTTKTSKGTCTGYLSGAAGCVTAAAAGATDCTGCAGIFTNVAPATFEQKFKKAPNAKGDLLALNSRIAARSILPQESLSNVANTAGDPLVADDTAVCHTESKFSCGNLDKKEYVSMAEYEANAASCTETESVKIDNMCDDAPCDNDETSATCNYAKNLCYVDPDSGVWCTPDTDNDPCGDCKCKGTECINKKYAVGTQKVLDGWKGLHTQGGNVCAVAFTSVLLFLAAAL